MDVNNSVTTWVLEYHRTDEMFKNMFKKIFKKFKGKKQILENKA